MTTLQFILFIGGLVLPAVYQRTKYALWPASFEKISFLRRTLDLNIHHGHCGLVLVIFSIYLLIFGAHNWFSIGLAGTGLGLMLDEIPPMLEMQGPGREEELEVYSKTSVATVLLIGVFCVLSSVLFLFFHGK